MRRTAAECHASVCEVRKTAKRIPHGRRQNGPCHFSLHRLFQIGLFYYPEYRRKVVDICQIWITFFAMQETLSIKVTSAEKALLKAVAARRGVKLSTLLRMGLEAVTKDIPPDESPSCYDLTARFFEEPGHIGSSGLGDLSTNKGHLKDFGASK